MKRRWMLPSLGAVLVGLIVMALWAAFGPNEFPGGGERVVYVSHGQSFVSIVDSLESKGIIRSRLLFVLVARTLGGAGRVQVGKYRVQNGISNLGLLLMLRSGKGNQLIAVTIPEGSRVRLQAKLFARAIGIDSATYARLAFDPDYVRSLGINEPALEGYLLPDTYGFYWEQDEREVLRREVENFERFFSDSLKSRCAHFGWTTHDAVTFASIVEGEAVLNEERSIIAGVYHNRLKKGMRLEADPTIQYMISDGPRRIYYSDLKSPSPYNTYRFAGLPPGPVNNPGKASILASLYPVENAYLFFVANGSGGHWFARTFAEHMHFVRMFRRHRRQAAAAGERPDSAPSGARERF